MYESMYNVLSTIVMIVLTLIAISIITYCVRKVKKGADLKSK